MKQNIFVNLKRFEIPRRLGGVCPVDDPQVWIEKVIAEIVKMGLGGRKEIRLVFFLPEALLLTAARKLVSFPPAQREAVAIGCQGVYREDVAAGGNFGAFTTNLPATAAKNLGCTWSIIGHSEERSDKLGILERFEPSIKKDPILMAKAADTVDRVINEEVRRALATGLNVLLCVGETAAERGEETFAPQRTRVEAVLHRQLVSGLKGTGDSQQEIVIGYEPVWAIGPGKVPPDADYISYVSDYIKKVVEEEYGFEPPVVYGGGLKEENAGMLGTIKTINGGLVALTRFTGEIGFEPEGLNKIVDKYLRAVQSRD